MSLRRACLKWTSTAILNPPRTDRLGSVQGGEEMAFISLRSALSRVRLHPIENALSTRLRHSQVLNGCPVFRQASFDCMVDSFSTCSPIRAIRVQCRWRCAKCPQPRRSQVAHVCRLTSSSAHHASLLSMTLHADPSLCTLCCEAPEMLSFGS